MDAPRVRLLDSYSLTYAFSLLPFAVAIAAMRAFPAYAYDRLGYVVLLTAPPVLGVLGALLAERSGRPLRSTVARAALLAVLSLMGSVTLFTVGSIMLVPVSRFITPKNFGTLTVTSVGIVALIAVPLLVTLVRELVRRERGMTVRAAVLSMSLLGILGVVLLTVGSRELVTTLRKDQIVQLMAGLIWYLPTYGAAVALWRWGGVGE